MLKSVKKESSILHTIKIRKANWFCHMLGGNLLLKQVSEGNIQGRIEVTEQEEEDGSSYWMS